MSVSVLGYLEFSELAYDLTDGTGPTVPTPQGFEVLAIDRHLFGANAVAFVSPSTQQIVIAYRGTETSSAFDLYEDVLIAAGIRPPVFDQAEDFAAALIGDPAFAGYTFTVTGHSLGAAEASDAAAVFGLGGVTFGTPGVADLLPEGVSASDAGPLVDYVITGDPIAAHATDTAGGPTRNGAHVGTVETLPPVNRLAGSVAILALAGEDMRGVGPVLVTAILTEHFLPFYGEALADEFIIPVNPLSLPDRPALELIDEYRNFPIGSLVAERPDTVAGFDDAHPPGAAHSDRPGAAGVDSAAGVHSGVDAHPGLGGHGTPALPGLDPAGGIFA